MNLNLFYLLCFAISVIQAIELHFPKDFKFGLSTASYQIEGAWNTSGKGENIWDRYTHEHPNWIQDRSNGDIACDSYHNYKEDVRLLKELNVDFYRFSISWSRILSTGYVNIINADGIRYYNDLINELLAHNITPMVTIFHWDLPQPLQEIGGWPNELLADFFEDYARVVFQNFGDRVKMWITFNEPPEICIGGYGSGYIAPGYVSDGIGDYLCGRTVLLAHAKVYHMYDKEFRFTQKGKVGISINSQWFEPKTNSTEDLEAAERCLQMVLGWWAHPIFSKEGDYPEIMKKRINENSKQEHFPRSRLVPFTDDEIKYIQGTHDFFGFNHYDSLIATAQNDVFNVPSHSNDIGVTTYQDPSWPSTTIPGQKVVPWGLRKLLVWIKKEYDNPEVYITENGFADTGEMEDLGRIDYLKKYMYAMLEAINLDGCNVKGYSAWSLLDNFQWRQGYVRKFGLVKVDFNVTNRKRYVKSSAAFYLNVTRERKIGLE